MIYTWACKRCGHRVEVSRPVAEYNRRPDSDEAQHACPGRDFRKLVNVPSRIFVHENEDWYHRKMTEPL